jgi:hypothetical protein
VRLVISAQGENLRRLPFAGQQRINVARRGVELQAAIEPPGRLGVFVAQDVGCHLVTAGVLPQVPDHGIMPDQMAIVR